MPASGVMPPKMQAGSRRLFGVVPGLCPAMACPMYARAMTRTRCKRRGGRPGPGTSVQAVALAASALFAGGLAAAQPVEVLAPVPSNEVLEAEGAVIGQIWIERNNIFDTSDPEETPCTS